MLSNLLEIFENISPFSLAVSVIAVSLIIIYLILKSRDAPPGPTGLPYLGYWPFLKQDTLHQQLKELGDKYGDIFSFTICGYLYINLGSTKLIREAHVTKTECFAERVSDFSLLTATFGEGFAFINGEPWKVFRKFFMQAFRDRGMTAVKDNIAGAIYDNLNGTVDDLRKKNGDPVNIVDLLTDRCANLIRRILYNDDGVTSEELREINDSYEVVLQGMTGVKILLTGEFARRIILPFTPGYKEFNVHNERIVNILDRAIKRRESTFDENHIRDIIDDYFKERNERRKKLDPTAEYFTNKALLFTLHQFSTDGILTVAFFISVFIQKLIEHPEEQEKIYEEMIEMIGSDRQPTVEDKTNLPYTNAFILEAIRTSEFFPLFPSLQCTKETTVNGYRIPKGAITVLNIWSAHRDAKAYDDPEKFNPSRFLSKPGKKRPELPVQFGVGKRSCAGESFSMLLAFLYVTTLVKNFKITLSEGSVGKSSVFYMHGKMKICAHPRH